MLLLRVCTLLLLDAATTLRALAVIFEVWLPARLDRFGSATCNYQKHYINKYVHNSMSV